MLDILIIISFIATLVYLKLIQRPPNFPPGPRGIPILGNLLQLGQSPFLKFQNEWKEKYGPILGVYFGSYRTVAISDYRMIREALMEPALAGRPDMKVWHTRSNDKQARGIIFTEGEENNDQRRISIKALKEFGHGKQSFENVVTTEIVSVLELLEESSGEPIHLKNKFHVPILNILWHIVAGRDCLEDRQTLNKIFYNSTKILEENNPLSALFMFIPWLGKYFPSISGSDNFSRELKDIWKFLQSHIDEHKQEYRNSPLTFHDFIGAYIYEIEKTADPSSSFYKHVGDKNLMTSMVDLFFAGADTTAYTLQWSMLLFATHQDVQQKFFDEVDHVIGHSRLPETNDEANMPYTQALINEILRYTSLAPLAVFHSAMQDVRFHGFNIPKASMVLLNFHGAHHDKGYWRDPEIFRPDRFLSNNGTRLVKHDAFFPFGMGKRICIGEGMSRMELFLFLTSISQKFSISTDPETSEPSLDAIQSFLRLPPNPRLCFSKRMNL